MYGLTGSVPAIARRMPPTAETKPNAVASSGTESGPEAMRIAAAAGVTSSAMTRSAPMMWTLTATTSPSSSMKTSDTAVVGTPRAAADCGSSESKRSGRQMTSRPTSAARADGDEPAELTRLHRHDLAGEQAESVGAAAVVEREEQDAETQPERHEHADDRVAVARARAQPADDRGGDERADDRPRDDVGPDEQGGGGAREREFGDAVDRERHVALHHEHADESAHEPEHGARDDGVPDQPEDLAVHRETAEHRVPDVGPVHSRASSWSCVMVVRLLGVGRADHHQPVARPQHEHGRAVEVGEHPRVEHLVGAAEHEPPVREVQDAVHLPEHRVDVVRHEQHGGAGLAAVPVDEADHGLLVREVEARQRLVAQQQPRVVGERLTDAQSLLLAAGEEAHGVVGEVARADGVDEAVDALPLAAAGERQPEAMPVDAERHEVPAAQRGLGRQRALLRDVADPPVAAPAHLARRARGCCRRSAARGPGSRAAGSSCPSRWGRAPRRARRARR